MTEISQEITTLHAIRFQVDNVDESLAFYKKLGCKIEKVENSKYSISVYLNFSVYDSVMIHLFKDFTKEETLTKIKNKPVFELSLMVCLVPADTSIPAIIMVKPTCAIAPPPALRLPFKTLHK